MGNFRRTCIGDIITLSDTTSMFCLGRRTKTKVVYVYEEDNSAFVIDRKGKVRGLVYKDDYFYQEGDNELIAERISLFKKSTLIEGDYEDLENDYENVYEGDMVEIINPSFCYLWGESRNYTVLGKLGKVIYVMTPNGSVVDINGGYKKIKSSYKVFDDYWKKRQARLDDITHRLENLKK